jgi:hypothetical protein
MIDRETWWKPFALAFACLGIFLGGAFLIEPLYNLLAPQKTEQVLGVLLAWVIVTGTLLGLPAIVLLIGGAASLLIQLFRTEPPGSILNPNSPRL